MLTRETEIINKLGLHARAGNADRGPGPASNA